MLKGSLFAQAESVKELDRMRKGIRKDYRHRGWATTKFETQEKAVHITFLKENNQIIQVGEQTKHNWHQDMYGFIILNDTLTYVYYGQPKGFVRAYISKDNVIASATGGECILPDVPAIKAKFEELTAIAEKAVAEKTGSASK